VCTPEATAGFSPWFMYQVENGQFSPSTASAEYRTPDQGAALPGIFADGSCEEFPVVRSLSRRVPVRSWS